MISYLLKRQTFVTIGNMNDAAICEAMFLEDVAHDVIVTMGINAEIIALREAEA